MGAITGLISIGLVLAWRLGRYRNSDQARGSRADNFLQG
jgi:hypothetical protein